MGLSAGFLALTVAAADAGGLAQCTTLADDAQRLACYDAIARPDTATASATTTPASAFGLPAAKPAEPEEITAHLVGKFDGWQPGMVLKLDNGQTWKISAYASGYEPHVPDNAAVTISRGHFGSYVMEITAVRRRIPVKRIS